MTTLDVQSDDLFGLHNLPYGVYTVAGQAARVAVRYGDHVVDLGLVLDDEATFGQSSLNAFMAQGRKRWIDVRARVIAALQGDVLAAAVHPLAAVTLHLPFQVGDYVDFYASEHHASNLGRLFRPDNPDPLTPNWKHLPIGYHGRSSSIVVSGTDIVRRRPAQGPIG